MTRPVETNVATFRIGYPLKDSQGSAIEQAEGVQLEIQYPGTSSFVVVGSCDFPADTISWPVGPDGNYIARARGFFYKVKGKGCGGSCKRYGPASGNIAVQVREARPGTPPDPVELVGMCSDATPSLSLT